MVFKLTQTLGLKSSQIYSFLSGVRQPRDRYVGGLVDYDNSLTFYSMQYAVKFFSMLTLLLAGTVDIDQLQKQ